MSRRTQAPQPQVRTTGLPAVHPPPLDAGRDGSGIGAGRPGAVGASPSDGGAASSAFASAAVPDSAARAERRGQARDRTRREVRGLDRAGAVQRPSRLSSGVFVVLALVPAFVGALMFAPPFDSPAGAIAAAQGIAVGAAVAVACARIRWSALPSLAAVAAAHLAGGSLLLRDVGSGMEAVRTVLSSTVTVWHDSLTVPLPLSAFPAMTVLPWMTGLAGGYLTARARVHGWSRAAGLSSLIVGVVAITWGGQSTLAPAPVGVILICTTLLPWALESQLGRRIQVAQVMETTDPGLRLGQRRALAGAVVLLVVVGLGAALLTPPAPGLRTVLRDQVAPPLDLTAFPTPLSLVRTLETDQASTTLMTVSGLPEGARIRIAALDSYDGLSTRVSQDDSVPARFERVGNGTPLIPDGQDRPPGAPVTVSLTMEGYSMPWVPTVSTALGLTVTGPRATAVSENLFYDRSAATGLSTAGLTGGDVLTEQVVAQTTVSDENLATLPLAAAPLGPVENVPASVQALATSLAGSEPQPLAQIRALQQALRAGYYSDGTQSPSDPGHGSARIAMMVSSEILVGDDEQYATLMMLLCRSLGIPARVVMGFDPAIDGDATTVTGKDVSAWVEIAFSTVGWVPFMVTPPRDNVPSQQTTHKVSNPQPQVLQPPLPLQDPAELPPVYEDEPTNESQDPAAVDRTVLLVALGASMLLLLPPSTILAWKALRRRRRRSGSVQERVMGAWDEILDRARDLGRRAPAGMTRKETAAELGRSFPEVDLPRFGRAVDAQVFGPGGASKYAVDRIWESADAMSRAMGRDRSRLRRALARLSLGSLLQPASRLRARRRRGSNRRPGSRRRSSP